MALAHIPLSDGRLRVRRSDYTDVARIFGTLQEFDQLLLELKRRGMRLILDYVPNHTSDAHPWFKDSRSSRDSPKRDWYLWHDPPPGGGPPNNWLSNFGGSAWEWDEPTGQYYYHSFLKEQPRPQLAQPRSDRGDDNVLRFWLNRGVDGWIGRMRLSRANYHCGRTKGSSSRSHHRHPRRT